MDWRLLVAAMMVLTTLFGGTVLVAQVEQDLRDGIDLPIEDTGFVPPDDLPFKLKGLKLPSDIPIRLPPGTVVSPDLDKLTLPEDLDLKLPENLDLSGLDFTLPEDFDLQLPEGTRFDGSRLTLPKGADFTLPDGRRISIPPGTSLDVPPDLARRLLEQGLPLGVLPSDRAFSLADLPPGLRMGVDPQALTGGGSLRLPSGTTIQLPPGFQLPAGIDAGALAYAVGMMLPAGTTFDVPVADGANLRGRLGQALPLPVPNAAPLAPAPSDDGPRATPVVTEIDRLPARVRKGEPVRIEGYVREAATARGVQGAPVEVFLNETKDAPGVLVGRASTDAAGRFALTLDLPRDRPARQYQIVNHASRFTSPAGVLYDEGWGDPPLATYAATAVNLTIPSSAAIRSPTNLVGRVVDELGAPVESGLVELIVNNVTSARMRLGTGGGFGTTYTFATPGLHPVEARYLGDPPYYEPSAARAFVLVEETAAIEPLPFSVLVRGQLATFGGRAVVNGEPAPFVNVDVSTPFGGTIRSTTDAQGRFTHAQIVPRTQALGTVNVVYVFPDRGVLAQQSAEVIAMGTLSVSAPPIASLKGDGVPVNVTLVDDRGAPLAGIPVTVRLAGPGGSKEITDRTDAGGALKFLLLPSVLTPGDYVVSASPAVSSHVKASAAPLHVRLGDIEVRWSVPPVAVRGKDITVDATITHAGYPLADAAVTLDLFGSRLGLTDGVGNVRWAYAVPLDAASGPHVAKLLVSGNPGETPAKQTRVVAVPRLVFDTAGEYDPREGVRANLSMSDDGRAPMPKAAVIVTLKAGNWTHRQEVVTDADGNWSGVLDTQGAPQANLTAVARHDASPTSLEAEAARTVTVSARAIEPAAAASGFPWLIPIGIVAMVAAAGTGAWLLRDRFRKAPAAAPVVFAPPPPAAAATADLDLRLGIPDGEPLLWGVGEPLAVSVRGRGAPRPGAPVALHGGEGPVTLHLDVDGRADATLVPAREGELRVVAVRPGETGSLPVEVRVEIVDYRKAVAREFDALVDQAAAAGVAITRRTTPREAEAALLARLGADAAPLLDEVALLMEVTNYSRSPVARREFLRFLEASMRLRTLLPARGS